MSELFPLYIFFGLIAVIVVAFVICKIKQKVWLFVVVINGKIYEMAVFSLITPTIKKDTKTGLYTYTNLFVVGMKKCIYLLKEGSIEKMLGYIPDPDSPAVPIPKSKFKTKNMVNYSGIWEYWLSIMLQSKKS